MEEITSCDADIINLQVKLQGSVPAQLSAEVEFILSDEVLLFIYFYSAGGGDGAVLHFVSGNTKGSWLRRLLLSQVSCQTGF